MKKTTTIFIFFLAFTSRLFAQAPIWKVNEPDYQYTMTIVSKLNMDGTQLTNSNDMVAAFVGTTCRGVCKPTYVATTKSYYAYLTVFSNTPGELITFYLYNSTNNKIVKVNKTIPFAAYQNFGNLYQSYSVAEPALSDKADLLTFEFLNIKTLSSSINAGVIKVNLPKSTSINNLTPVFTLSKGANLFKNSKIQLSGTNASDFTSPVIFEVLSEDESKISTYTVNVTQVIEPPKFYKKDAVCAALGAIRVVYASEGTLAQISYNGKQVASKAIVNGEAIFDGLMSATYVATIGADSKTIIINQKN
jgi:hypothetical protein